MRPPSPAAMEPAARGPGGQPLLRELTEALGDAREARWVLAAVSSMPDPPAAARLMAARRRAGEPLQYVLGTWAFRELEVTVDSRVLVPRPETEQVVGVALEELRRPAAGDARPPVAVDLGTGSGVIALSLAVEGPVDLEVWAVDVSADALDVARLNLARLDAASPGVRSRVHLVAGSWFDMLPARLAGQVQVVVSNPPYVAADEWATLDPVVRDHEPHGALVAGPTGREALEHLVERAPAWLAPGGSLVAELAPAQASALAAAARRRGYADVTVRPDLAGRPRALVARWRP